MGLVAFVHKQLIDVLEWNEVDDETLAWRFPVADREIQQGAELIVRETQVAVFVHEGRVADVFGPGRHRIVTGNLPVLTDLRHWAKGFESPIKSDVVFLSTRLRQGRTWGTAMPITVRDRDAGAVRIRAFGTFAYRVADPAAFFTKISGTRDAYPALELEGQLRAMLTEALATRLGVGDVPFVDLAAHQDTLAAGVRERAAAAFQGLGLALEDVRLEGLSLPDELTARLDERIGMNLVGELGRYGQFQAARSIPAAAAAGGIAGAGLGVGLGMAMGRAMGDAVAAPATAVPPAATLAPTPAAPTAVSCPRCGVRLVPPARCCGACGAPL